MRDHNSRNEKKMDRGGVKVNAAILGMKYEFGPHCFDFG